MRIVDRHEMREIEQLSSKDYLYTESMIIENVGLEASRKILEIVSTRKDLFTREFHGFYFVIGKGNNGSDGLAMARHLSSLGHNVVAYLIYELDQCSTEFQKQYNLAKNFGVQFHQISSQEDMETHIDQLRSPYVMIDCILGTGFKLPLDTYLSSIIQILNTRCSFLLSMDIPSGLDCDNGTVSPIAVKADLTFAVGFVKTGFYLNEGPQYIGEVFVLSAGFPQRFQLEGDKILIEEKLWIKKLTPRNPYHHKNSFGHCLVIGGSPGLTGALSLASTSALKVGCGLVTAMTWKECISEFSARCPPEIMIKTIPEEFYNNVEFASLLNQFDCIVIGPGLGQGNLVRGLVLFALNSFKGPVVLDADAINSLDLKSDSEIVKSHGRVVLTPHIGEFSRLLKIPKEELLSKSKQFAESLTAQTNAILVLKSFCTLVVTPDAKTYFNYSPNHGMATAGSGDVLAGIIGGFLTQRKKSYELTNTRFEFWEFKNTVLSSIAVHTLAGKLALNHLGGRFMSASNIIDHLPGVFKI